MGYSDIPRAGIEPASPGLQPGVMNRYTTEGYDFSNSLHNRKLWPEGQRVMISVTLFPTRTYGPKVRGLPYYLIRCIFKAFAIRNTMIKKLINYLFILRLTRILKMKEGKIAPDFALKDKDGNIVKLSETNANYTILYFYPKDNTPGCTIEANEFTSVLNDFEKLNVKVIGISGGNKESKKKFCEKNELRVTLLSDPDFQVCKKYEAYGEKQFMGKTYNGIFRITYILDKNKKVIKTFGKVKASGHAKEVLDFVRSL